MASLAVAVTLGIGSYFAVTEGVLMMLQSAPKIALQMPPKPQDRPAEDVAGFLRPAPIDGVSPNTAETATSPDMPGVVAAEAASPEDVAAASDALAQEQALENDATSQDAALPAFPILEEDGSLVTEAPAAAEPPPAFAAPTIPVQTVESPEAAAAAAEQTEAAAVAPPPIPTIAEPILPDLPQGRLRPRFQDLPEAERAKTLSDAPDRAIIADSRHGPLPVIGRNGEEARKIYARPFTDTPGKGKIAVIVSDLGMRREASDAAIFKLPADVTLSFSPYAREVDKWMAKARFAGHETLIDLPMQEPGFPDRDPGPLGLLAGITADRNIDRIEQVLAKGMGYVGVLGPTVTTVTASPQIIEVMRTLKGRGLLFVGQLSANVPSAAMPVASDITLVVDDSPFAAAIDARLSQAEAVARETGAATIVLSAHPVSLQRLTEWLKGLGDRGLVLAPISAVAKDATTTANAFGQ